METLEQLVAERRGYKYLKAGGKSSYREPKSCLTCIFSERKSGGYYHPGGQYQDMSYLKCTNEISGKIRVTEHGICDKWLGGEKWVE